jgi:hypothetical protein
MPLQSEPHDCVFRHGQSRRYMRGRRLLSGELAVTSRSGLSVLRRDSSGSTLLPGGAQTDEQVGLAGAASDGDRLQHLRAVLPCPVRVTAAGHPLFGELLAASAFRRFSVVLHLVVVLPDGSPGTIRADATDVLAAAGPGPAGTVLDAAGVRALRVLVTAMADATSPLHGRRSSKQVRPALLRANDFGKVNLFACHEVSCCPCPAGAAAAGCR